MRRRLLALPVAAVALAAAAPLVAHANIADDITRFLLGSIARVFIGLGQMMLTMGGWLMNFAIDIGIASFGRIFGNVQAIQAVWSVLRDVANTGLIFLFIAAGFGIMLGISKLGDRKVIVSLLVAAVFINFSFYITRLGIDLSHMLAVSILNQADALPDGQGGSTTAAADYGQGLASAFAGAMALGDAINPQDGINGLSGTQSLLVGLMTFLVLSTAGVVFASIAFMLLSRVVQLVLAMVISPVAFVGAANPNAPFVGTMWAQWKEVMTKQVVFAPVLVLMLVITVYIMEGFSSVGYTQGTAFALGNVESVYIVAQAVIGICLLFASVQVAQSMGAAGSDVAGRITDWWKKDVPGMVGTYAVGGAAAGGRRLYRPLATATANVAGGVGQAARKLPGGVVLAKGAALITQPIGRALDKTVSGALDAGVEKVNFGTGKSMRQRIDSDRAYDEKKGAEVEFQRASMALRGAKETLGSGTTDDEVKAAEARFKAAADALDKTQFAGVMRSVGTDIKQLASYMTSSKFKEAMKDADLSEAKKAAIAETYFAKLVDKAKEVEEAEKNGDDKAKALARQELERVMRSQDKEALEHMPEALRTVALANAMTDDQYDHLEKKWTDDKGRAAIGKSMKNIGALAEALQGKNIDEIKQHLKDFNISTKRIAQVVEKTVMDPKASPAHVTNILTTVQNNKTVLRDIVGGGRLSAQGRAVMSGHLQAQVNAERGTANKEVTETVKGSPFKQYFDITV